MGLLSTVDLCEIIDYSPSEFLELIKPRLQEYFDYLRSIKGSSLHSDQPYEILANRLGIKAKYSMDIRVRKKKRIVFGGVRVEVDLANDWAEIIFVDMYADIIGKINISLAENRCVFAKWDRDMNGRWMMVAAVDKLREVIHYDTPEDLK